MDCLRAVSGDACFDDCRFRHHLDWFCEKKQSGHGGRRSDCRAVISARSLIVRRLAALFAINRRAAAAQAFVSRAPLIRHLRSFRDKLNAACQTRPFPYTFSLKAVGAATIASAQNPRPVAQASRFSDGRLHLISRTEKAACRFS